VKPWPWIIAISAVATVLWLRAHDRRVATEARVETEVAQLLRQRDAFLRGVRVHDLLAQRQVDSLRTLAQLAAARASHVQTVYDSLLVGLHRFQGQYVPIATVREIVDTANRIIFELRSAYRQQGRALQFATLRADSLLVALDSAQILQQATAQQWRLALRRLHPPLWRRLRPSLNAGLGTKGWDIQIGLSLGW
jgi:hypothetical protein